MNEPHIFGNFSTKCSQRNWLYFPCDPRKRAISLSSLVSWNGIFMYCTRLPFNISIHTRFIALPHNKVPSGKEQYFYSFDVICKTAEYTCDLSTSISPLLSWWKSSHPLFLIFHLPPPPHLSLSLSAQAPYFCSVFLLLLSKTYW